MADFWKNKKILVTGGRGFVGGHVVEQLISVKKVPKENIIIPDRKTTDLRDFESAKRVVSKADIVLHLAADVGGIGYSSTHPATQLRNVLLIDANMFEAASQAKIKKFVCISSAVAYPADASSPLKEEELFKGEPAKGGYGYGFAKRMAVVMARAYKEEKKLNACVLLSANSFGPGESFDLESGHVIPSLIRKCFDFKKLEVWGDGNQIRDFFYVKDFAKAVLLAAEKLETSEPVNIGSGTSITIKDLVGLVVKATDFKGQVYFDKDKPQGQKIRTVDITRAKRLLGFEPSYTLEEGIKESVDYFKKNYL